MAMKMASGVPKAESAMRCKAYTELLKCVYLFVCTVRHFSEERGACLVRTGMPERFFMPDHREVGGGCGMD